MYWLLGSLFNVTVVFECYCFIAAVMLLDKKTGLWQLFIPFMLLTICVEIMGWYWHFIKMQDNNSIIFTCLTVISGPFVIWQLAKANELVKTNFKPGLPIMIFFGFAIINLFSIQGILKYNSYTEELGNVICIAICCNLFYLILKQEEVVEVFKYEYFWLATGLLFYSLGSSIVYLFHDALAEINLKQGIPVSAYVLNALNVLLYGSLIVAFICRRRNTR